MSDIPVLANDATQTEAPSVTVPEHKVEAPVIGDGPIHTHRVTYAGLFGVAIGIGLVIVGFSLNHIGNSVEADAFFSGGLSVIMAGVGGATFGKSPAIR